jgi:ribosomal protein S18 acetylase RimI-like enzyme
MEHRTWHFPPPMTVGKLSKEAEQQLFYDLAKEFSEILQRNVNINRGFPISYENGSTNIHYHAAHFELSIRLEKNYYLNDYPESLIKIAWLGVHPHNLGYGTKLMKHFLGRLSETSFERVILHTRDEEGRRFWRRLGFTPDCDDLHLDWFLKIPH